MDAKTNENSPQKYHATNNGLFIHSSAYSSSSKLVVTVVDSSGNFNKTTTDIVATSTSVNSSLNLVTAGLKGFEDVIGATIYSNKPYLIHLNGRIVDKYLNVPGTGYFLSSINRNRLYVGNVSNKACMLYSYNRTTLSLLNTYTSSSYSNTPSPVGHFIDNTGGIIMSITTSTLSTAIYWNPITGMQQTIVNTPSSGSGYEFLQFVYLYGNTWYLIWAPIRFSIPSSSTETQRSYKIHIQKLSVGSYSAVNHKDFTISFIQQPSNYESSFQGVGGSLQIEEDSGYFTLVAHGKLFYGSITNTSTSFIIDEEVLIQSIPNNPKYFFFNNRLYDTRKGANSGKVINNISSSVTLYYINNNTLLLVWYSGTSPFYQIINPSEEV